MILILNGLKRLTIFVKFSSQQNIAEDSLRVDNNMRFVQTVRIQLPVVGIKHGKMLM